MIPGANLPLWNKFKITGSIEFAVHQGLKDREARETLQTDVGDRVGGPVEGINAHRNQVTTPGRAVQPRACLHDHPKTISRETCAASVRRNQSRVKVDRSQRVVQDCARGRKMKQLGSPACSRVPHRPNSNLSTSTKHHENTVNVMVR